MSFKDFLSGVPAVIAALAALSFILTAIREWGYYRVIGSKFIFLMSGRALARAPLGGGFPVSSFRLRGGFTFPP